MTPPDTQPTQLYLFAKMSAQPSGRKKKMLRGIIMSDLGVLKS